MGTRFSTLGTHQLRHCITGHVPDGAQVVAAHVVHAAALLRVGEELVGGLEPLVVDALVLRIEADGAVSLQRLEGVLNLESCISGAVVAAMPRTMVHAYA